MSDLPYEIILGFIGVCAAMAAGFGVLALRSSRWRRVGRRGLWVAVAAIFSAIGRWATTLPLSPGQSELVYGLHDILGLTVTVLFVSFMIALTDQFLDKAGRSRSSSAPRIIRDMLHGMIIAVACAGFVVITLQMPLIGFVTTTGAVAIVLGIALQSILKDPFAGLLLTFEKPFEIGQWIVLENQTTGLVLELNWRTTRLRTKNGNEIVVPNGAIATSKLINLNRPVPHFNCWVRFTVERSATPGQVRSLLMEVATACPGVLIEPEPVACLRTINENNAVYSLEYWIRDLGCECQICEMLIEQVADNFSNAAIRLLQTASSID